MILTSLLKKQLPFGESISYCLDSLFPHSQQGMNTCKNHHYLHRLLHFHTDLEQLNIHQYLRIKEGLNNYVIHILIQFMRRMVKIYFGRLKIQIRFLMN